ncbi:TetR/AcrR family transcriptional regulator [Curtobacterium sp. MCBD17_028]|uniref:TetR/AcrR family transcriptional regulator n=1 Tax=Curtobacterium sp. MCBD17_028 TaxID=2175670 RepID=UPI000DA755C9|nr:TetR/AcrR family transcriptional regulator [Curtobacterium sp. MCBD17_028]PZE23178.1 hypothetical protein DEI86_15185 [Curtobacterium sp. MCBD17_028]
MSEDGLTALEGSRLRASERCCELFIARGTTDISIAEIADAVGISPRSFYRYFPIKAESVGPMFDATIRASNAMITGARPDAPLLEVLVQAFHTTLFEDARVRTRAILPLVFEDPEMWSVFIRKLHDGERSVAPILAPRLGVPVDSLQARTAAAAVASALRIALEVMVTSGGDPAAVYAEALDAFAAGPLRPRDDRAEALTGAAKTRVPTGTEVDHGWQTAGRNEK